MPVTHQYHLNIMHKSTSKGEFDICRERHPTGLHGYKASKKNRTGDDNDSGKNNE